MTGSQPKKRGRPPKKANKWFDNKKILAAVIESRNSFCSIPDDPSHMEFDFMAGSMDELIQPPASAIGKIVKVRTEEHIDQEIGHECRIRFPCFKHFIVGQTRHTEVFRSHWNGTIMDGHCSITHGAINDELAKAIFRLPAEVIKKENYRAYPRSVKEDMLGIARQMLTQSCLRVDEAADKVNPHAQYTTIVMNSFLRIIKKEKKRLKAESRQCDEMEDQTKLIQEKLNDEEWEAAEEWAKKPGWRKKQKLGMSLADKKTPDEGKDHGENPRQA